MTVTRADDGGVELRQPADAVQLRPGGTISGPTLMTLADTVASVEHGAAAGVDLVMPSYPLYFNPASTDEVVSFTKAVADAGGEILGMLTTAVHAEVPTRTLLGMMGAFPTVHRAVVEALQALEEV